MVHLLICQLDTQFLKRIIDVFGCARVGCLLRLLGVRIYSSVELTGESDVFDRLRRYKIVAKCSVFLLLNNLGYLTATQSLRLVSQGFLVLKRQLDTKGILCLLEKVRLVLNLVYCLVFVDVLVAKHPL